MSLACLPDAALDTCTTLRLPARAAWRVEVTTTDGLHALLRARGNPPRLILGGGSNVVLTGDFDGIVLHVALHGRTLAGEDDAAWYVTAAAGEEWDGFVRWTLAQGWPGLENLVRIPGTVGAAPIQNIGAYGLELGERLAWVDVLDLEQGSTQRLSAADCRLGYRDSRFKQEGWHRSGRCLITAVTFRLPKVWTPRAGYADLAAELAGAGIVRPTPAQVAAAVDAVRQRKLPDPARLPNAGSFFQNPQVDAATAARLGAEHPGLPAYPQPDGRVKLAAGWLIEQAGWKGRRLGPVGMYERQALVLVNHGGARGRDVAALAAAVRAAVRARFGVDLEPEPLFVP